MYAGVVAMSLLDWGSISEWIARKDCAPGKPSVSQSHQLITPFISDIISDDEVYATSRINKIRAYDICTSFAYLGMLLAAELANLEPIHLDHNRHGCCSTLAMAANRIADR
jgi:hypothetical protein